MENNKEKQTQSAHPSSGPEESPLQETNISKSYDRKTRIKAWIGIGVMIALTLGYFYVFYSGQIINW